MYYLSRDQFIHVQHINNSCIEMCCSIITLFKTWIKKLLNKQPSLKCSQKGHNKWTNRWYEAVVQSGFVDRLVSIIDVKEQLINLTKKVNSRLQLGLRVISLCVCWHKCYEFPLGSNVVGIRTTEDIPVNLQPRRYLSLAEKQTFQSTFKCNQEIRYPSKLKT